MRVELKPPHPSASSEPARDAVKRQALDSPPRRREESNAFPRRPALLYHLSLFIPFIAVALLVGSLTASSAAYEAATEITVEARQFSYNPPVVRLAQGQRVKLTLHAMDVTHGMYLDGLELEIHAMPGSPAQVEFVADKSGQFRFRCTQPCGSLHPFMVGKLIVEPNQPFNISLAIAALISLALPGYFWLGDKRSPVNIQEARQSAASAAQSRVRPDLLSLPIIGPFLRWRGFQFALMLPLLALFVLALAAGFFGSAVGGVNFATIFVWLVWWSLLILLLVPLGGRLWCAVCPVPGPGEWLQRLSFVRKREGRLLTFGLKWPSKLQGVWVQNGLFLLIAVFSAVVFTSPAVTAAVLAAYLFASLVMALLFQGRTFCRYVCPLGGFIGMCALAAPLALRVKDREVCRRHQEKECIKGSARGYGCPWFEYPGSMERNAHCGLCMECVKTCPRSNIAVGFQPVGRDLLVSTGRDDEAYRIFIALASATLYSAVMAGPWGWLKSWAGRPFAPEFGVYVAVALGGSLVIVPGLFLAAAWLSRLLSRVKTVSALRLWKSLSYGLVPLAVAAWIALSLSLLFVGGPHVAAALSDPLGRGWNLFGLAGYDDKPVLMGLLPYLQAAMVLAGLAWSITMSWQLALKTFEARKAALLGLTPFVLFLFGAAAAFLWLHIG
ncbi:MAG: cupredoxin domain-containing protein [Chloroflexi bacterium]|nr:cupredoxin domain-containing protein [Chloroflexota bacterium]